jgi:potassium-transporting ATPase potassium-binding subunit
MSGIGVMQIVLFAIVLTALVKPLGDYMAKVYLGERTLLSPVLDPLERVIYRLCGIDANAESSWQGYATGLLWFNFIGFGAVCFLQRWQDVLPLNPQNFPSVGWESAFNTAISFASNTNWQGYSGETTSSPPRRAWRC